MQIHGWLLMVGIVLGGLPTWGGLLPFPLSANQRGTVTCLENPNYTYDCYLPPGYSTNGTPLPILYTMSPGGGGMVSTFQPACSAFDTICIGITQTKNGMSWDQVLRAFYAVSRDVRLRILYDPTEEFAGGLSGGGECAYMFSRFRAQHVAGLIEMAGWLGRDNYLGGANVQYYGIDRVQTNLLVMRTTGTSDTAATFYNPLDRSFLTNCNAQVFDLSFSGGHQSAPLSVIETCLQQLLVRHQRAGPNDRANAQALANNWQARIAAGQSESVFRECVSNLLNFPRSWYAYQAQLTLDQLLTNYDAARRLDVSNLAQGDSAADLFYYYARGAAANGDWPRYDSCLKALTGITVTNDFDGTTTISGINVTVVHPTTDGTISITTANNDHGGDIYDLLTNYNHYPDPLVQCSPVQPGGQMDLLLAKDTPELSYSVQSTTNLLNGSWQDLPVVAVDSNTVWSTSVHPPPGASRDYYRIVATPTPAYSPFWPPQ